MNAASVWPESLEEKLVYWVIVSTWGLWLIGALYLVAPALGWGLVALSIARRHGIVGDEEPYPATLPSGCVIWIGAMSGMLITLFVGHLELGLAQMLKSTMGWVKGWGMFAVFVFIGSTMRIRPALIYRASNVLAAQTLALSPLLFLVGVLHLPTMQYVSPLVILGGAGPDFFNVELYRLDLETGAARWQFYAPWAPAAGMMANIALVFAIFDRERKWQVIGVLSTVAVCFMCQSRLAYIVTPVIGLVIVALSNLTRPVVLSAGTAASVVVLPFIEILAQAIEAAQDRFKNARAASSRVRATLQSIARHRWWNEAPIWGHGTVERGPHLVEFMPIGSHHTWNGLLFVKGLAGFTSFALPFAWTVFETLAKAQSDPVARAALGIMLVLFTYTFAENLEILIYLFWPGMIIVGIAMKRRFVQPFHNFMTP